MRVKLDELMVPVILLFCRVFDNVASHECERIALVDFHARQNWHQAWHEVVRHRLSRKQLRMWEELPSLVGLDQRLEIGVGWRVWVDFNVAQLALELEIAKTDPIRWFNKLLLEPFVEHVNTRIVRSDLWCQIREHDLVRR